MIRRDLLVTVCGGLDKCRYGVYWLLILRDQPVVRSLGHSSLRQLVGSTPTSPLLS